MTDDLLMGIPVMFPDHATQQVYADMLDKVESRLLDTVWFRERFHQSYQDQRLRLRKALRCGIYPVPGRGLYRSCNEQRL